LYPYLAITGKKGNTKGAFWGGKKYVRGKNEE